MPTLPFMVMESWGLGGLGLWVSGSLDVYAYPKVTCALGRSLGLSSVSKLAQVVLRSSPNLTTAVVVKA